MENELKQGIKKMEAALETETDKFVNAVAAGDVMLAASILEVIRKMESAIEHAGRVNYRRGRK